MSGFFLAINRRRNAFAPQLAGRMMRELDRFGDDAKQLIVKDHFALGYQSHWSVPEEVGEKQPIVCAGEAWFVFHGRVDNRPQLFGLLGRAESSAISDAVLCKDYFEAFGPDGVDRIIGPFVFLHFDPLSDSLFVARDPMGARYLVYRITDDVILVASYEMALVAHDSLNYDINQEKAARYLLNDMENVPSSLIDGVHPLNPGMFLKFESGQHCLTRFYKFSPDYRITLASGADYAAEFRRLLKQAVERRSRCVDKLGTMLSGGMDSVPMTILAKQSATSLGKSLTAFSWVFDKYPKLDERKYSSPVCDKHGIEQVMINCDELWPSFDGTIDLNPIVPFGIPFSEFQEETLRIAKAQNVTTLLSGIHGDLLYEYTHGIIYELLKQGRILAALKELVLLFKAADSKHQLLKVSILRPLKLVQRISAWRQTRRAFRSDILNDKVAEKIVHAAHWLDFESRAAVRPQQWRVVLDGFAGDDAVHGRYLDAIHGVERRYPFRDRDLCEFILAIPSEQLYFNLCKRPIVKRAFLAEYTPQLLERNDKTNFSQVIYSGMEKDSENEQWFRAGQADWQEYVKQCYFNDKSAEYSVNPLVRWRCGYYAYWKSTCYNPLLGKLSDKIKN